MGTASLPRVYTIGHSSREWDELMQILDKHAITVLVDVRSYPSSRTFPQWNQQAIIEHLPSTIEYRWLRALGGRRHTPADVDSPHTGWRVKSFRDYADHMATEEFRAGLDELKELATTHRPVIMCSEAVPWRCHRRLITDALLVRGVEVFHIMSRTSTKAAETTAFARVRGEEITYPGEDIGQSRPRDSAR